MKQVEMTKEMKALIQSMNDMIEFNGHDPKEPKMELLKSMYIDNRITADEFFTLIK